MRVLSIGNVEDKGTHTPWAGAGLTVEFLPLIAAVEAVKSQLDQALLVEATVCIAYPDYFRIEAADGTIATTSLSEAIRVGIEFSKLPDDCAMADGRKWKSVPFLIVPGAQDDYESLNSRLPSGIRILRFADGPPGVVDQIKAVILEYRQRILDELDNLGFLVSYSDGRFVVGPALEPREGIEGNYYSGRNDSRLLRRQCYTVDRDSYGIQREVEAFEALINSPHVTELNIQRFFEDHPHFLVDTGFADLLPHVRLPSSQGLLIPDFVLRPVVASQRDSRWEVLDLKMPQAKVLVGTARRRRLSEEVHAAIRQLRDYGDFFANPENESAVRKVLGHPLRHPRLAVLIGRMPRDEEVASLELEQTRNAGVRIVTYDEILMGQQQQI